MYRSSDGSEDAGLKLCLIELVKVWEKILTFGIPYDAWNEGVNEDERAWLDDASS